MIFRCEWIKNLKILIDAKSMAKSMELFTNFKSIFSSIQIFHARGFTESISLSYDAYLANRLMNSIHYNDFTELQITHHKTLITRLIIFALRRLKVVALSAESQTTNKKKEMENYCKKKSCRKNWFCTLDNKNVSL